MRQVLGDFFDEICDRYSEKECIYFPTTGITYTYENFKIYVHDIEKGLIALGLKKGDLIAIKSENTPEWLAMQWAGFKLGIVVVGLNAALTQIEVMRAMNHTGAKILFTDDISYMINEYTADNQITYRVIIWDSANQFIIDLGRSVSDSVVEEMNMQVEATDRALILFTSGTTSEPKAVEMRNGAILGAMDVYGKNLTYGENENALVCTPLAHMMGCLYGVIPVLNVGGKVTILEKFKTSRVLEIISTKKCTIFNGVPTMFLFLLNEYKNEDISSLRTGLIAGSYVSPKLYERIYKELGVKELLQAFGQTETLAVTGTNMNDPFEKRMYSTGRALENVEIKIDYSKTEVEENGEFCRQGEILVRSPYCMQGYLKNEKATAKTIDEEGWLHTGDLGDIDEDGYLYIKSRIKDIIIKAGENICPAEIENALVSLEGIKEAVVVGVPDPYKTEEICAFVVPEKEEDLCQVEVITEMLKKCLAKYKLPKYVIRVSRFNTTSSGKVKKEPLRQLYTILSKNL